MLRDEGFRIQVGTQTPSRHFPILGGLVRDVNGSDLSITPG